MLRRLLPGIGDPGPSNRTFHLHQHPVITFCGMRVRSMAAWIMGQQGQTSTRRGAADV